MLFHRDARCQKTPCADTLIIKNEASELYITEIRGADKNGKKVSSFANIFFFSLKVSRGAKSTGVTKKLCLFLIGARFVEDK